MADFYRSEEDLKPILPGKGATDYERYLRIDDLLSLQKPPEEMRHPDEMTFQIVHQSSELLLKSAIYDLEHARAHIDAGEYRDAVRLIRRANMVLDHPIGLLHVLETLTPYDYHIIRAGLGHGSGLDSPGFLGLLRTGPPLGDAFFKKVTEAGISLEEMYRRYADFHGLHDLAEALLDFDERVQYFRFHHLKLAQRIIGPGVIGTGGAPVDILKQRQDYAFYKQLWEVRNQITARANESMQKPAPGPS
jgi:tryptophan 2,3-dioxygenase